MYLIPLESKIDWSSYFAGRFLAIFCRVGLFVTESRGKIWICPSAAAGQVLGTFASWFRHPAYTFHNPPASCQNLYGGPQAWLHTNHIIPQEGSDPQTGR